MYTLLGESRALDPAAPDGSHVSNTPNPAEPRELVRQLGRLEWKMHASSVGLDLPGAGALATAVDAFVRAGMVDHARPLAAELLALLTSATGASAGVVPITMKRRS
jgi:hypothetical protein